MHHGISSCAFLGASARGHVRNKKRPAMRPCLLDCVSKEKYGPTTRLFLARFPPSNKVCERERESNGLLVNCFSVRDG